MKGINKNGELYKFIMKGQNYLKNELGIEDVSQEISDFLANNKLEEIYDDRFYADRECVYMLIETMIASFANTKAQKNELLKRCNRYKKENARLEQKVKELTKELSILREREEMREGDF